MLSRHECFAVDTGPRVAPPGTLSGVTMTDASGLVERIVEAIGRLVARGETIEDEWTYVHDLETVWVARLRAVAAARAAAAATGTSSSSPAAAAGAPAISPAAAPQLEAELEAALDRLVAETDLITDPHRAIDWLSTLPQATLVALGEAAW